MMHICRLFSSVLMAVVVACAHQSPRDQVIDYMALYHAADAGDDLMVRALLERGAPVNALGPDVAGELSYRALQRDSRLQAAAEKGHTEIVRLLIARGAWLEAQCCDSPTPLGFAAREGHVEIVQLLLDAGADPSGSGGDGTALEVARKAKHEKIVQMLEAAQGKRR